MKRLSKAVLDPLLEALMLRRSLLDRAGLLGLVTSIYAWRYTGVEYWWKDRYHDFDVYRENRNVYLLILYGRKTRKRILSLSKRANHYWIEKVNDPGIESLGVSKLNKDIYKFLLFHSFFKLYN